jgi:hypothetical protein
MRHFLVFFSILLLLGLIQCTENPVANEDTSGVSLFKGPGNGGGNGGSNGGGNGGGHTETAGNNLSFPAFLVDGYSVVDVAEDIFSVEYTGEYPGITDLDHIAYLEANGPWYAQKTEGNLWQADYEIVTTVDIDHIDWGDAIEAVDPKLRRPYRLELVLYKTGVDMEAFTMAELEYPSSKDELQGTNTNTYQSPVASVASTAGEIVVQRTEGIDPNTLTWNELEGKWNEAEDPIPIAFQVENNVGGKLIFGASLKGWKPDALGSYRLTFYVSSGNVNLRTAEISNYLGNGEFLPGGERNFPVVDVDYNLTYVDVNVVPGGGGGGGH